VEAEYGNALGGRPVEDAPTGGKARHDLGTGFVELDIVHDRLAAKGLQLA
jgi:hypothetical protein